MSTQHFTLVLDHKPSGDELDALYEAGLDDATPATVSGTGWLHVDREADSLGHALTTAIRDVESTGLRVCAVAHGDLVSLREIARRAGVTYEAARLWSMGKRGPGGFPPHATSGDGWSLWSWAQVAWWLRDNELADVNTSDEDRLLAATDLLVRARNLSPDEIGSMVWALVSGTGAGVTVQDVGLEAGDVLSPGMPRGGADVPGPSQRSRR